MVTAVDAAVEQKPSVPLQVRLSLKPRRPVPLVAVGLGQALGPARLESAGVNSL